METKAPGDWFLELIKSVYVQNRERNSVFYLLQLYHYHSRSCKISTFIEGGGGYYV